MADQPRLDEIQPWFLLYELSCPSSISRSYVAEFYAAIPVSQ